MSKPTVNTRCVASFYASTDQRIVEIGRRDGKAGCLVSIREHGDGLHVDVYRADPGVTVTGPGSAVDLFAALRAVLPYAESRLEDMREACDAARGTSSWDEANDLMMKAAAAFAAAHAAISAAEGRA